MADELKSIHFPRAGVDLSRAFDKQTPRHVGPGRSDYARTTPIGNNVRTFEALTNTRRGGSRSGLSKFMAAPVVLGWVIQHIDVIITTNATAEV